tara:strand:- start:325 stop:603 length:279 start_codon:yes stop_codon:yes gene_type:complete
MKDLKRIKAIAKDIISDREWVNDSHSESEHKGVVNGLNALIHHIEMTDETDETNSEHEMIKEIRFHLLCFDDGTIDGNDLANGITEIINSRL